MPEKDTARQLEARSWSLSNDDVLNISFVHEARALRNVVAHFVPAYLLNLHQSMMIRHQSEEVLKSEWQEFAWVRESLTKKQSLKDIYLAAMTDAGSVRVFELRGSNKTPDLACFFGVLGGFVRAS